MKNILAKTITTILIAMETILEAQTRHRGENGEEGSSVTHLVWGFLTQVLENFQN